MFTRAYLPLACFSLPEKNSKRSSLPLSIYNPRRTTLLTSTKVILLVFFMICFFFFFSFFFSFVDLILKVVIWMWSAQADCFNSIRWHGWGFDTLFIKKVFFDWDNKPSIPDLNKELNRHRALGLFITIRFKSLLSVPYLSPSMNSFLKLS